MISIQIKKRILLLTMVVILSACSASGNKHAEHSENDENLYFQMLEVTQESTRYKGLIMRFCLADAHVRASIPVICNNLELFYKIPDDDINAVFLPYAKQYIEPRYLPELIEYYRRKDIQELSKKADRDLNSLSLDELRIYNQINKTTAGKQYSDFITVEERFNKAHEFSTRYILRQQGAQK